MIGAAVDPSAPARIVVEQRVEWPDTDAADYTTRLWFGQRVEVDLGVARIGRSSLTYRFEVRSDDTTAARGEMTIVHTGTNATGAQQWPEAFRAVLAGAGQQPHGRVDTDFTTNEVSQPPRRTNGHTRRHTNRDQDHQ